MTIDSIESSAFTKNIYDSAEHMKELHAGFDSKVKAIGNNFEHFDESASNQMAKWIGEEKALSDSQVSSVYDTVKQMYHGAEDALGRKTMGIEEISGRKVNPEYEYQNMKQHAGFAAEIIGTAKENLKSEFDGIGVTTYRADDRPDLFPRNDPYVDKIRVDRNGKIIERVQTKFVGKDADSCL